MFAVPYNVLNIIGKLFALFAISLYLSAQAAERDSDNNHDSVKGCYIASCVFFWLGAVCLGIVIVSQR